ncbi:putative glycolipid-binding domain-containing protein [Dactylosporangium aurantiacum]|uniref:Glycolipid-binding domain-containing protein n=1 Tax=Dactylosporangium aurantiacum TaxID=35754 RepID=A0A9Q9IJ37_9ACTN|nr:putative glycolipid-binding domain-containing protein [Dactylosporangium aurantiacum]MDG6101101.1 putative glycolipid-binding domain-containing protein [Dactylosporangium aurantiacum]UWZ54862.1 putative glycolipid-binding domain-containing protein [Dactylosporangium aurantiacum]
MTVLPRAFAWQRTDTAGGEFVTLDDRRGLYAKGTAFAADNALYSCRYELHTDEGWASTRLEVTAEGAGWRRTLKMERAAGRWRVTTGEQGDLERVLPRAPFAGIEEPDRLHQVLDVDLYNSPLTNTLPVRRLGLHRAAPGTVSTIEAAWVLLPSLAVLPLQQVYEVLPGRRVRYRSETFTADLQLDDDGYVVEYPGLAELA